MAKVKLRPLDAGRRQAGSLHTDAVADRDAPEVEAGGIDLEFHIAAPFRQGSHTTRRQNDAREH